MFWQKSPKFRWWAQLWPPMVSMWSQLCPTQGSPWPLPTEATTPAPPILPRTQDTRISHAMIPTPLFSQTPFPSFLLFHGSEQAIFNMEAAQKRQSNFEGVISNLLESVLGMWGGCCSLSEDSITYFWQWHIQVPPLSVAWLHWNLLVPAELSAFPHKTRLFP